MWMGLYLLFFETLFLHVDEVAGWNRGEMILLLAFYYYISGLGNIFYKDGFEEFSDTVRQGKLDQWLVKPAPIELMAFFGIIRIDHFLDLFLSGLLYFYAVFVAGIQVSLMNLILGILLGALGAWLLYGFLLFIGALVLILERLEGAGSFIWNVTQLLRYPRQIYTGPAKPLFEFIFPIALIVSVPTEVARGGIEPAILLYFIGSCIIFYGLGHFLFKFTLKRYQSAN
jgi:ABC-2 type transport system permease protein